MNKFLALLFAATVVFNTVTYEQARLGVELNVQPKVELQDTFVWNKPATYRERLEYQVSRGEIRAMDMTITAYDLSVESCGKTPDDPAYGITKSGEYIQEGFVAVDPEVIPLNTRLYIDGYGVVIAKDTGGLIKGKRLDIYIPNRDEAIKWGVQKRKVFILGRE